ncbi:uncharacterized protein LOC143219866 [Lasioglossum baleicum]|uniref:uncharacterized protein LOC143219866 n=1 Tax=Lasioglossum baleicum TaxID=434251 RepID=UPI003FCDC5EF
MRLRLTFRLTQVLSGHGCFGEYLHRMGREPTAQCHHCDAEVDTARHTLEECRAWAGPRRALCFAVEGWDLSLPVVLVRMIESERSWRAVTSFCEEVMSRKEVAERAREADPNSARRSTKRTQCTPGTDYCMTTERARRRVYCKMTPPKFPLEKVYGAGEGYPSTGGGDVVARASPASSSGNRDLGLVDHLATREVMATSDASVSGDASHALSVGEVPEVGVASASAPPSLDVDKAGGSTGATGRATRQSSRTAATKGGPVVIIDDTDDDTANPGHDLPWLGDTFQLGGGSDHTSASGRSHKRRREHQSDSDNEQATGSRKGEKKSISRKKDSTPAVAEMARQISGLSTGEIMQEFLQKVRLVETTALKSGNLKGTYVRDLKVSARYAEAALLEVVQRGEKVPGPPNAADLPVAASFPPPQDTEARIRSLQKQNEHLRGMVAELEATIKAYREEMMTMKRSGVASQLLPPPAKPSSSSPPRAETTQPGKSVVVLSDPPPPSPEPGAGSSGLLEQLGALLDAKLAPIKRVQARLSEAVFGPPRSPPAPRNGGKVPADPPKPSPPLPAGTSSSSRPGDGKKKKKKKTKKKKSAPAPSSQPSKTAPARTVPVNPSSEGTWADVVGRKAKRAAKKAANPPPPPSKGLQGAPQGKGKGGRAPPRVATPPKTAAISLSIPEGCKTTLAEAMAAAKAAIKLSELGVGEIRTKRAVTGGLLLEIPGPEGGAKADALASKMAAALIGLGVRVNRPLKTADLRLRGLDDSVTPEEVKAAVAEATGCPPDTIKVGDIKSPAAGLGTTWLKCPAAAARLLAGAGKLRVGWSTAKVEALAARPLQCFRCLAVGHVRQRCTSTVDRSGQCYKCGVTGHRANVCPAAPRCPICTELGRPAGHKAGSGLCPPLPRKGRKVGGKGPTDKPTMEEGGGTEIMEVDPSPSSEPAGRAEAAPGASTGP